MYGERYWSSVAPAFEIDSGCLRSMERRASQPKVIPADGFFSHAVYGLCHFGGSGVPGIHVIVSPASLHKGWTSELPSSSTVMVRLRGWLSAWWSTWCGDYGGVFLDGLGELDVTFVGTT